MRHWNRRENGRSFWDRYRSKDVARTDLRNYFKWATRQKIRDERGYTTSGTYLKDAPDTVVDDLMDYYDAGALPEPIINNHMEEEERNQVLLQMLPEPHKYNPNFDNWKINRVIDAPYRQHNTPDTEASSQDSNRALFDYVNANEIHKNKKKRVTIWDNREIDFGPEHELRGTELDRFIEEENINHLGRLPNDFDPTPEEGLITHLREEREANLHRHQEDEEIRFALRQNPNGGAPTHTFLQTMNRIADLQSNRPRVRKIEQIQSDNAAKRIRLSIPIIPLYAKNMLRSGYHKNFVNMVLHPKTKNEWLIANEFRWTPDEMPLTIANAPETTPTLAELRKRHGHLINTRMYPKSPLLADNSQEVEDTRYLWNWMTKEEKASFFTGSGLYIPHTRAPRTDVYGRQSDARSRIVNRNAATRNYAQQQRLDYTNTRRQVNELWNMSAEETRSRKTIN